MHHPRSSRSNFALIAAAAAAATAFWVHRRARRAEREHPPMGRYIHIDGVRLHFVERGQGRPVVLVHGNSVTLEDFVASGLVDRLAQDFRVIAFDRPGFGHSTRPRDRLWTPEVQAGLLHRALAALDVHRAVVVGHSMGSMVALAMALDHPDSVTGLVLAGGYYYPSLRVDALLMAPVALPVLGDAMRYTVTAVSARAVLEPLFRRLFAPRGIPPGYLETLDREMLVRPSQLRANAEDAAFMVPQARRLSQRLGELTQPLVLLVGRDDKIVHRKAQSGRLAHELAQALLLVVPGAGHMVHHAAREEIAGAVGAVMEEGVARTPLQRPAFTASGSRWP